jgi:hypothetical protein
MTNQVCLMGETEFRRKEGDIRRLARLHALGAVAGALLIGQVRDIQSSHDNTIHPRVVESGIRDAEVCASAADPATRASRTFGNATRISGGSRLPEMLLVNPGSRVRIPPSPFSASPG